MSCKALSRRIAGLADPQPIRAAMNGRTATKGTLAEEPGSCSSGSAAPSRNHTYP